MRMFTFWLTLAICPNFLAAQEIARECNEEVNKLLQLRANSGDAGAQLYLGDKLLLGPCSIEKKHRGVAMIEAAANSGYAPAQFRLGTLLYVNSENSEQTKEAVDLIEAAAQFGLSKAQSFFGIITLEQAADQAERDNAMYWLGSAANLGNAQAAMATSTIYSKGINGVRQDDCLASLWAEAASLISNIPADFSGRISAACQ